MISHDKFLSVSVQLVKTHRESSIVLDMINTSKSFLTFFGLPEEFHKAELLPTVALFRQERLELSLVAFFASVVATKLKVWQVHGLAKQFHSHSLNLKNQCV